MKGGKRAAAVERKNKNTRPRRSPEAVFAATLYIPQLQKGERRRDNIRAPHVCVVRVLDYICRAGGGDTCATAEKNADVVPYWTTLRQPRGGFFISLALGGSERISALYVYTRA